MLLAGLRGMTEKCVPCCRAEPSAEMMQFVAAELISPLILFSGQTRDRQLNVVPCGPCCDLLEEL